MSRMRFAQISDTHILSPDSDHQAVVSRAENLAACVADINRQAPDFVIFTGDTVQHGAALEYALLRELLVPLQAPLYAVPGNRDENDAMREALVDDGNLPATGDFLHYTVESYPLRLIALDSTAHGERKGRFCRSRQDWLAETLDTDNDRATMLFIHHPPFDVGDHYIDGYRHGAERAALTDIVASRKQVRALICGHVHWPIATTWAGVAARIMPSVAVDLRKGVDDNFGLDPVYMMHEMDMNGTIKSRQQRVAQ